MQSVGRTGPSAQIEALGAVGLGLLIGVLFGWLIATALSWRNLKGSFALPVALVGYVLTFEWVDLTWGPALMVAGALGGAVRTYWRHEDKKAGGNLARRARARRARCTS